MLDLRAIVRARMAALGIPSIAELGRRMAPRWAKLPPLFACFPDSAESRLHRWFDGSRDMTSDALAELLDELGLTVTTTD